MERPWKAKLKLRNEKSSKTHIVPCVPMNSATITQTLSTILFIQHFQFLIRLQIQRMKNSIVFAFAAVVSVFFEFHSFLLHLLCVIVCVCKRRGTVGNSKRCTAYILVQFGVFLSSSCLLTLFRCWLFLFPTAFFQMQFESAITISNASDCWHCVCVSKTVYAVERNGINWLFHT